MILEFALRYRGCGELPAYGSKIPFSSAITGDVLLPDVASLGRNEVIEYSISFWYLEKDHFSSEIALKLTPGD
jgi:hypothetical protein